MAENNNNSGKIYKTSFIMKKLVTVSAGVEIDLYDPETKRNKKTMFCKICKCKVLRPGFGTLIEKPVSTNVLNNFSISYR